MKQKKIKVIAMVLSLFAACGGISSAMETSKSGENSKVNSKSGQNKNKTQNNKPQSNGKRNENSCVQIPYYAYPVGYLGLNEVGNLLGFDYLLFGRCGIIKGAKHLLFGESNKKVEVEKGPYWQHNYDMIMSKETVNSWNYTDQFKKTMERIMKWPNEKILLGKPEIKVNGNYQSLGNNVTGFSHENFLENLRGKRQIKSCNREVSNTFEFLFEGINDMEFTLTFFGGFWGDANENPCICLQKSSSEKGGDWIRMDFSAQPGLYSW